MSETSIAWTHYTFNPWWGCTRVSPGCEHCYAETFSHRLGLDLWGPSAGRRLFDDHWNEPVRWAKRRAAGDPRHLVFCASMADVFEDRPELAAHRARLWDLIAATPGLTWQLLTKRPENVDKLAPASWVRGRWPANVWLLVTAEDQERADKRIPILLRTGARLKGVSYEPALGPVNLRSVAPQDDWWTDALDTPDPSCRVNWVIVGGESGPGARPFDIAWARSIVAQCREAGVAVFVKQLGARPVAQHPMVRGALVEVGCSDRKGGDMSEWTDDLRVREFPGGAA